MATAIGKAMLPAVKLAGFRGQLSKASMISYRKSSLLLPFYLVHSQLNYLLLQCTHLRPSC